MKWQVMVHELYERIGVDCENVTLIVKRVDLLPGHVMSQLLNLMSTGEIPGCFTLKEQVNLATRVRDEYLVEIESKFHAQNTRIRQEVELQREKELTAIKREEKETLSLHDATFYQEFERIHQQTLALRLAQAQLRYQQDCDDYTRKCEVETESVTATIMSLMRPLGITSGRWQQIVDRIRKRLRVVFIVDYNHHDWITSRVPELLPLCNVVTTPIMLASDLHTIFYGHFHSEVQRLMRLDRFAVSPEIRKWEDFVVFMKRVEHALPDITKMAVEIHLSATKVASRRHQSVPTWLGMALPTYFAKALEKFYNDASETLSKAERFLYVCENMEIFLSKLKDGDDELRERLSNCDRKIAILEEAILQQQEDGDRICDMMRRFQESAEEQVQITNEMEKQAQVELNVPLGCLEEANAALLLIEKRHIIEIKSFNSPPLLVHLVFDAICVMFGMEPAWDNARKILSDASVVQNMLNYDKDNMSDDILSKLQSQYISDDRFHREEVEKQSVAASMMVIWVRAIHQYASTRRVVKPTLDKLEKAQSRLRLLMQEYQMSKQRVADADEQLLQLKNTLGETIALKQSTTDEIESRASRLESGESVLEFLSEDRQQQEKTVERMHKTCHHGLAWWNALFDAALLAYAGRFHLEDRKTLLAEWECAYWRSTQTDADRCETKCCLVPSIHVALREKDEEQDEQDYDLYNNELDHDEDVADLFCEQGPDHAHWELVSGGVCFSRRRLQDAFFLGQVNCAAFPAVLITKYTNEIEDLVLKCARNLWKWNEFFMVSCKAEDFDQVFVAAVTEGHQLLILDVEPLDGVTHFSNLSSVFNWRTTLENGVEHLAVKSSSTASTMLDSSLPLANASSAADEAKTELIPVHSSLRLILTSYKPQSAFGEATLRLPTLDATLYVSEIPDVILDKMWNPGVYENAESTKLKLAIRDYHDVAHIGSNMQDELTKHIQEAAAHGDFQVAEMQVLREQANAIKELRVTMQRKRIGVEKEIAHTRKLYHIAKLGAAIYNSFNTTISAHASLSRSMHVKRG
uniref:Dynein heavy chain coiled coil stalk domain-containing protein n=1 Tax=Globisporangium ultimum (strain ATCC 200006 / CBS 805.95 / DAOM BR144) TaxID=431595 RepID=K3WBW3_GLOUD